MSPKIPYSTALRRTSDPAITDLMQRALANPALISLAAGFVDQNTLPAAIVQGAASTMLADPIEGTRSLQYGTTRGDTGLRRHLTTLLEHEEGVPAGTYADRLDRVVISTGSQQLLYLVGEALLDPGDIVLVEAPTYFVYLGLLETRGVRAIGVATDEGGLCLESLERTLAEIEARGELERVKLIYTVSEHSNPTGLSLAADRRRPLVELARKWSRTQRIFVLEDAAYRGLNLEGPESPSVWSQDEAGDTVILARTFSKTFSPGLKTGFGVLPEALVAPVLKLKGNHDFGSSHFTQQLLDAVLTRGEYRPHIDTLVKTYGRKRDVMLGSLCEHLGPIDGVTWTYPLGGIYVWLTVPEGLHTGMDGFLFARCVERGVLYVPGELAYAREPGPVPTNRARLCYGVANEAELEEGVRRLAAALAECLDPVA